MKAFPLSVLHAFLGVSLFGQVQITVTPATADIHIGTQRQFTAAVSGATDRGFDWAVNGIAGGDAAVGRIAANGTYTPPVALPSPPAVTITAVHRQSGVASAGATVRLLNPFPMLASVRPAWVATGPFSLTINGSGFVSGTRARLGAMDLLTTFVSATRLLASGVMPESIHGPLPLSVANPEPGGRSSAELPVEANIDRSFNPQVSSSTAARFLEQAAFGPDRASIEHVQRLGLAGWLDAQFEAPVSAYQNPEMIGLSLAPLQARFFTNAVHGSDQLRQRVVLTLSEIWVVSGSVASTPERFVPYLRVLQKNAFGNYWDLIREMTLCPPMGEYLNMLNNAKADPARGTRPNENYARELLQLFTVGTDLLNPDGTYKADDNGNRVPTYLQKDIHEFARALTGWSYPPRPGSAPAARNPANYTGPMVAWEASHDTGSKTLLNGMSLPGGRLAADDLNTVVDNVFFHPNAGPFLSKRLIQHLVKSNPSPGYVERVVRAFEGNPGDRGDMRQVIRAVLLDPEARGGDDALAGIHDGYLREPVLWLAAVLRALDATVNDTSTFAGRVSVLGQNIHYPPTVFSYYMPGYQVAGTGLLGPEFQLLTPTTALDRANFVNAIVYQNLGAGAVIDFTNWISLARNPKQLVDEIDVIFFRGTMPFEMWQTILGAVLATEGERAKAQAALYLAASSGYYSVQH